MKSRRSSTVKPVRMLVLAFAVSSMPALAQRQGCAYLQELMSEMSDKMGQMAQSTGHCADATSDVQKQKIDQMQRQLQQIMKDLQRSSPAGRAVDEGNRGFTF